MNKSNRDKLKSLTDEEYKYLMDSLEENEELMVSLSNVTLVHKNV